MLIFGGFCDLGRSNDIYRLHFKENRWEKLNPVSSEKPCERAGHSAVVHGDNMVIYGGKDDYDQRLNDVWSFNIPSAKWT